METAKKKITNWESIFNTMIGYWFEVNGIYQMVKTIQKHKEKVEVVTTTRTHYYTYEEVQLVLYDWKPVNHQDVEAFDILKYAMFEGSMPLQTQQNESMAPIINSFEDASLSLITQNAILLEEQRQMHNVLKNKYKAMLSKLDTNQTGPNFHKDFQDLSQMTNDIINMEVQELKGLAQMQYTLQAAKQFVGPKKLPGEKSDNNQKD